MKIDDMKILLQRYYNGGTSEKEEQQLKEFFVSNEVPEEMMADKTMFLELAAVGNSEIPEGLNDKISAAIDKRARRARTIRLRIFGGIAAMLCIIFSVNAYITRYDDVITAKDTCETPEEAAIQTERALLAFSKALKKGQENLDKAEKTTEEASHKASKILIEQLNKLNNR